MAADELFRGTRLKVRRALEDIQGLQSELDACILRGAQGLKWEYSPSQKLMRFASPVTAEETDYIATAVGSALHSLRSSLDLMAVEIVRRNNQPPKGVHFPFGGDEAGLRGQIMKKHFDRAPPEAIDLLLKYAPYGGPAGNRMLRALHDFNITDKHQTLIGLQQIVLIPTIFLHSQSGRPGALAMNQFACGVGVEPEILIPGVPDHVSYSQDGYTFKKPLVELEFATGSLDGEPLVPTLNATASMTQEIIEAFAALLG